MPVTHFVGANGIDVIPVTATTPLPVTAVSTTYPTGASAQASQGTQNDNVAVVGSTPFMGVGGLIVSTVGGPAAGTSGRFGVMTMDLARRQIVKPLGNSPSHIDGRNAITTTTETSVIAALASNKTDLQSITVVNRDNVVHTIDFRDALAGTIRETITLGAGLSIQLIFPAGRPNAAANAAWTAQLREVATTAVEVCMSGYRTTA